MLLYIGIALTLAIVVWALVYFRGQSEGIGLSLFLGVAFGGLYAIVLMLISIPLENNYTDIQEDTKPLTSFSEYAGTGEGGKLVSVDSAKDTVSYVQDGQIIQVDLEDSEFFDSADSSITVTQSEARHWWFMPGSVGSLTEYEFNVPSDRVDFTTQK